MRKITESAGVKYTRLVGNWPVLLVAATGLEAKPLLQASSIAARYVLATKPLFLGTLGLPRRVSGRGAGAGDRQGGEEGPPPAGYAPADSTPTGERGSARESLALEAAVLVTGVDKTNVAHALTCVFERVDVLPRLVLQVGIAGAFPALGQPEAAKVGDVVLATREIYADTGSSSPEGWLSLEDIGLSLAPAVPVRGGDRPGLGYGEGTDFVAGEDRRREEGKKTGKNLTGNVFDLDQALVEAAARILSEVSWSDPAPGIRRGPFVTSSRITGTFAEAEALVGRWQAVAESMEGAAAAHICALYGVPFLEIRGVSNMIGDRDRASWQVGAAAAVAAKAALAVVGQWERLLHA
ncbi:MAG: hypothetical protein H5T84_09970 [Thermoleophilia bacterium]|nr:hypothetical protein [Thermoleophilia bacterium]